MLEWITQINNAVNGVVWGPAGLALLFGTGLIMSVRTGFFQFRKMGYWLRHTIGAIFTNKDVTAHTSKEDMAISQSQSRHDHVGDNFHVLLQRDVQPGAVFGRDTAGHIAHARDVEHGAGSDADGEFTSGEGRHAVRSPVFHDGNPDKSRPRLVGNVAPDHELPLRGLRPDFESGEQAQTERQDQSAE